MSEPAPGPRPVPQALAGFQHGRFDDRRLVARDDTAPLPRRAGQAAARAVTQTQHPFAPLTGVPTWA